MNSKKKWIIFASIITGVLLVVGLVVGHYYSSFDTFFNQINDGSDTYTEADAKLESQEPFSILLLGLDAESSAGSDDQKTDTMMVLTVNPQENSTKILSIPRDTAVEFADDGVEKINAMYQIGGTELARSATQELLDIPIDFYAIVEFEAVIEIVNAVGGITVDSEFPFTVTNVGGRSNKIEIEEGIQDLNGEEALGYARMRKQDPRGDFGRQERQQEVVGSIIDELISFSTLTQVDSVLEAAGPYLQTNLTGEQMVSIASNYSDAVENIDNRTIEGANGSMYFPHYGFDVYIFEPYQESIREIQETLREHLEVTDDNHYTTNELNIVLNEPIEEDSEEIEESMVPGESQQTEIPQETEQPVEEEIYTPETPVESETYQPESEVYQNEPYQENETYQPEYNDPESSTQYQAPPEQPEYSESQPVDPTDPPAQESSPPISEQIPQESYTNPNPTQPVPNNQQ